MKNHGRHAFAKTVAAVISATSVGAAAQSRIERSKLWETKVQTYNCSIKVTSQHPKDGVNTKELPGGDVYAIGEENGILRARALKRGPEFDFQVILRPKDQATTHDDVDLFPGRPEMRGLRAYIEPFSGSTLRLVMMTNRSNEAKPVSVGEVWGHIHNGDRFTLSFSQRQDHTITTLDVSCGRRN